MHSVHQQDTYCPVSVSQPVHSVHQQDTYCPVSVSQLVHSVHQQDTYCPVQFSVTVDIEIPKSFLRDMFTWNRLAKHKSEHCRRGGALCFGETCALAYMKLSNLHRDYDTFF